MPVEVVITGVGTVTPLGLDPREILRRVEAGESVAAAPTGFDATPFSCRLCAEVKGFEPQRYVSEPKLLRLMNRDAQLAVAAAHLALQDAGLKVGADYPSEEIALFGATGLAGLPLPDVAPLVRASARTDGAFDPILFSAAGLKAVSPILSFKILSNMPVCFVSICENLQGPNAVYTPWEGQGAQAIEAGVRAIGSGEVPCAVVGGCDAKTHELAFLSLEQLGVFESWQRTGAGPVPGEGAVFLVLEDADRAAVRGARGSVRISASAFRSRLKGTSPEETRAEVLRALEGLESVQTVVSADDRGGDRSDEAPVQFQVPNSDSRIQASLRPKPCVGNLFAGAAALQVALGAVLAQQSGGRVLAECFGHGSEQAAFLLEAP
jgi:3-oxoacyl-[acyl-carrier-protein] synthase II